MSFVISHICKIPKKSKQIYISGYEKNFVVIALINTCRLVHNMRTYSHHPPT